MRVWLGIVAVAAVLPVTADAHFTLVEPPVTAVTTLVGVPASADVPPHGPAFCGSPSRFSISHEGGSISVKCASAVIGTVATTATIPSHTRVASLIARYLVAGT